MLGVIAGAGLITTAAKDDPHLAKIVGILTIAASLATALDRAFGLPKKAEAQQAAKRAYESMRQQFYNFRDTGDDDEFGAARLAEPEAEHRAIEAPEPAFWTQWLVNRRRRQRA